MDIDTKMKLKPILLRSKLGQFVSEGEQEFARRCWREWPKEYSALQAEEVNPEAAKHTTSVRPGKQNLTSTQLRTSRSPQTPRRPPPRRRRT